MKEINKVLITGISGFIGRNLYKYLEFSYQLESLTVRYRANQQIKIEADAVIHLAGKPQSSKRVAHPKEYYEANCDLTKQMFDAFLVSEAKVFIILSSVKAIAESISDVLTEEHPPFPLTHYGKSKLCAEQYILSKKIPKGKRVYILRPCIVHGPGNKGNLNLLYKFVLKGIPWPMGAFHNKRSYCSIDNLLFIVRELIRRDDISCGVYNVADDESLSTNEVISLLSMSLNRKTKICNFPQMLIRFLARLGDVFYSPLSTERLNKLTASYVVSNRKIKSAIGKHLPVSAREGLFQTFQSFKNQIK